MQTEPDAGQSADLRDYYSKHAKSDHLDSRHAAAHECRSAELAATEHELARTGAAIDRYLTAFENGTLDPEDLAGRLTALKARSRQLSVRRDELTAQLAEPPTVPPTAILQQVADCIGQVISSGSHNQRKALIEALVAQVKITGPGRIVPVFRILQPAADTAAEATRTRARTATHSHEAGPGFVQ